MQERDKMERNADPPEVFGGRMSEDIVEGVAGPEETVDRFPGVFLRLFGSGSRSN